jgi:hypothetical protein
MRRFSLFRRGRVWYVRLHNPKTNRYTTARSTGEVQKNSALLIVAEWMRDGVPDPKRQGTRPVADMLELDSIISAVRSMPLQPADAGRIVDALRARGLIETAVVKAGPGAEALVTFLERFWSYTESPYIREKLAHGHRLGRRHAYDMQLHVRTHWKPYFTDRRLAEVGKADLQAFSLWLKEEKGLQGKTINNVLAAGTVALRWAHGSALIPANPADGLMQFSGKAARRGVLTEEEVARLYVRHAWSNLDGLKAPSR